MLYSGHQEKTMKERCKNEYLFVLFIDVLLVLALTASDLVLDKLSAAGVNKNEDYYLYNSQY